MINQIYLWFALSLFILSGCATDRVVGFQSNINPILQKKCQQCHLPPDGKGYVQTGLNMESYDTLMHGTVFGKVIIPGDSKRSVLNKLVEGRAGEMMRMPHGEADKLTAEEVEFLKLWLNQGALNN
ncbi:MAG: hypothetical protein GQ573_08710 [Gammaproteobacteria bacterium]|nr:hypothetical protein [Gammaproteobacteria bacterium]